MAPRASLLDVLDVIYEDGRYIVGLFDYQNMVLVEEQDILLRKRLASGPLNTSRIKEGCLAYGRMERFPINEKLLSPRSGASVFKAN